MSGLKSLLRILVTFFCLSALAAAFENTMLFKKHLNGIPETQFFADVSKLRHIDNKIANHSLTTVSYTHLTLPTIYSV